ncbi:MAG: hypothetical protein ACT4OH_06845 [Methylophilaceae bacterium]
MTQAVNKEVNSKPSDKVHASVNIQKSDKVKAVETNGVPVQKPSGFSRFLEASCDCV